ncbi:MAG TPA: hypothetical protein VNN80_29385, partial [Polyangiaceae bacterium]|nr:hypothetical protein [Polyangiaceae bacterium]
MPQFSWQAAASGVSTAPGVGPASGAVESGVSAGSAASGGETPDSADAVRSEDLRCSSHLAPPLRRGAWYRPGSAMQAADREE